MTAVRRWVRWCSPFPISIFPDLIKSTEFSLFNQNSPIHWNIISRLTQISQIFCPIARPPRTPARFCLVDLHDSPLASQQCRGLKTAMFKSSVEQYILTSIFASHRRRQGGTPFDSPGPISQHLYRPHHPDMGASRNRRCKICKETRQVERYWLI